MAGREAGADGLRNRRASRAWRFTAHANASPDADEHRQKRADLSLNENRNSGHGGVPFIAMHNLFCRHCNHWLSQRGMLRQTVLSSVVIFSTDKCPDGITLSDEVIMSDCYCKVQDFKCGCGMKIGYETLETCSVCSDAQHEDKDHKWILSADCVTSQPLQLPNGDWKVWHPSDQPALPKKKHDDENQRPNSLGAVPPLPKYTMKDNQKGEHTPFSSPLADLNGRQSAEWKSPGPLRGLGAANRSATGLHVSFAPQAFRAAPQPSECSLDYPSQNHPSIDPCCEPLHAHLEGIKQREAWVAAKEEHLMMLENEMLQQSRRLVDSFCCKAGTGEAEQMNLVLVQLETMKAEIALMQRRHSKESLDGDSQAEQASGRLDEESEPAERDIIAARVKSLEAQLAVAEADAAAARAEVAVLTGLAEGGSDHEAATSARLEFARRMAEKKQGLNEWEDTLKARSAKLDERESHRSDSASAHQAPPIAGNSISERDVVQGMSLAWLLPSTPAFVDRLFYAVITVLSCLFAAAKALAVIGWSLLQYCFYSTGARLQRLMGWACGWQGSFFAPSFAGSVSRLRRFSVAASPVHTGTLSDGSGVPPSRRLMSPVWSSPGRSSLALSATTPGWSTQSGFSGFAPSPVMTLQPVMEYEGWLSWARRVFGFGRDQYSSMPSPQVIYTPQTWSASPW
eukprot:TRINITY_DN62615_c0_g1_i1.p1 TRINITY_DN62615_c0_g1~~TRINITY_DN62615_c0_g1_i1.p1  ORF type:complete len:683 (-),score=126.62 TRINITY_DN62615_c0_g1_i1:111-2159(-)